jgi:lysosomal alpha-mannosidase
MIKIQIFLLTIVLGSLAVAANTAPSEKIRVHLVPHTHDDVGWLETYDGYFQSHVHSILDTMTEMLTQHPTRKFVYVEMAFFKKWWDLQTDAKKDSVRLLVKNKQFEIVNAGWSMNDEACPYYEDIIDNMQTGIEWISKELGFTSFIGWQLDPFGHSSTNARIQAKLGFDFQVFSRMNQKDREQRFANQTLRSVWTPNNREKILIEPNVANYCEPGWMLDETYKGDPKAGADKFYAYVKNNSAYYQKKVILQLLGCDFQYVDGPKVYENHLVVLQYIWDHPETYGDIEFKYSIPSEYLEDLKSVNEVYTEKTDDYWAYGEQDNDYWSGYFTSRPLMKYMARYTGKAFQAVRQFLSFNLMGLVPEQRANLAGQLLNNNVEFIALQLGVAMHHDAVSGTAKQFVQDDYYTRLNDALHNITGIVNTVLAMDIKALFFDTTKDNYTSGVTAFPANLEFCDLQDPYLTSCLSTNLNDQQSALLVVYNPTDNAKKVHKVPVKDEKVTVYNNQNQKLPAEVFCESYWNGNQCWLFFVDGSMKAFGTNYYLLRVDDASTSTKKVELSQCSGEAGKQCSLTVQGYGQDLVAEFVPSSDKTITFSNDGETEGFSVAVDYRNYIGMINNGPNSGAYVFRPNEDTYVSPRSYSTFDKIFTAQGEIMSLARLEGDFANCTISFNHAEDSIATSKDGVMMTLEPEIGPLSISGGQGQEVVQILTHSTIENNSVFYTDSNGLDMQKRTFGRQPTFDITPDPIDVIPSSYYPVNAAIYVQDSTTRMTVLTDRSEGGTSRGNGQIETMMHRTTVLDASGADDQKGVGEALKELGPDGQGLKIRPLYHVLIEKTPKSGSKLFGKVRNHLIDYRPMVMYGALGHDGSFNGFVGGKAVGKSQGSLPEGLKIFMDYKVNGDYYLMRLHNISESPIEITHHQLVHSLEAGAGAKKLHVSFQEMSMSDLETLHDMKKRVHDWKTVKSIEELDRVMKRVNGNRMFGLESRILEQGHHSKVIKVEEFDVRTFRMKVQKAEFEGADGKHFAYWQ